MEIRPVRWENDVLVLIDQTQLPHRYVEVRYKDWRAVAEAIRQMVVRGAPAIGAAAACGLVLAAQSIPEQEMPAFRQQWLAASDVFAATRPTAVNLFWAIERMKRVLHTCRSPRRRVVVCARRASGFWKKTSAPTALSDDMGRRSSPTARAS